MDDKEFKSNFREVIKILHETFLPKAPEMGPLYLITPTTKKIKELTPEQRANACPIDRVPDHKFNCLDCPLSRGWKCALNYLDEFGDDEINIIVSIQPDNRPEGALTLEELKNGAHYPRGKD